MVRSRTLVPLVALFFLSLPAAAQPQARTAAPARLQAPAEFLGYALGERFTPYHRVVAYVRHVAAASPRARLQQYGTTYEGRPLLLVTLSAPDNLARLEAIREGHLRGTGLLGDASASARGEKAIVWLSYNVHGDEAVGTEAALKMLYALADPQNGHTGRWLQEAVVLLDPCLNPDGRQRYVQWYRSTRGAQPNARPIAREHSPRWPGGRTNHYLFDLNRDWAWAVQRETRARLVQYHRWMPHVHVDFHEQGVDDPYYFAPGAEPMHEALTPFQRRFQERMGRANAEVFDREGWLYFTGEVFDLFYPGYGDTWPLFNGAIGMTYEQAGGGRAGLLIQTATDSLSLAERVAHHHATGLTTVETAVEERAQLLEAFSEYWNAGDHPPADVAAYVVSGANEDRRRALADLLDRQHIRYHYAAGHETMHGTSYATGDRERFEVAPGDLVVPAVQPKARLAKVLFERRPALSDSLTYDITAWALPYAFDLEAHATEEVPEVQMSERPPEQRISPLLPGEGPVPYAYLAEWQSLADARLLARLLEAGVRVRFVREPFEAAGRRWGRGTLVIARGDNEHLGERFTSLISTAAQRPDRQGAPRPQGGSALRGGSALGVRPDRKGPPDSHGEWQPLVPLEGGLTTGGPDFGSSSVALLEKPEVAVLTGSGTSPYSVGEVWHFFDRRLRYPATLLSTSDFHVSLLDDFDVLVLPSGDYSEIFPEEDATRLHQWVERGGRIVALGAANDFLAGVEGFGLKQRDVEESDEQEDLNRRYDRRERAGASGRVPGAIFLAALDPTHPLAYGYAQGGAPGDTYYTLKRGAASLAPLSGDGWNVAVLPPGDGGEPVSGFAGEQAQQQLAGTLVFGVEEIGEGRAVYLVDDPLFRGFWQGGMLLFSNAVFLVGQ